MSSRVTGTAARSRCRTQSNPFSFGEQAARRADDRFALERTDEEQIARIDRHAEMLDGSARLFDRGGDDVAPVGNGRRAEDDDKLGLAGRLIGDRSRQRPRLVRHPAPPPRRGRPPASREPRTCTVLSTILGFRPGIRVEITPVPPDVRRCPQGAVRLAQSGSASIASGTA